MVPGTCCLRSVLVSIVVPDPGLRVPWILVSPFGNKVEDTNKLLERSLISVPPPVNRAADHEPGCDEDEVLDHKFSGHGQQ